MSVPTPFYPVYDFRFTPNSKWKDSSGYTVRIVSVCTYDGNIDPVYAYDGNPGGLSDYCVIYEDKEGNTYQKDAWCFQVRYSYCG